MLLSNNSVINSFYIKSFVNSKLSCNKIDEAGVVAIAQYIKSNDTRPYQSTSENIRKLYAS